MCVITSGRTWGAAGWRGSSQGLGKQQLKWTQSGRSLVWPCKSSACQRHRRTRLLVCQCRGLNQTRADVVKEMRPQNVCSEERTVVHHAVLMRTEVRAPPTSALWRAAGAGLLTTNEGLSGMVDWTTGLEYWNGLNCCIKPFLDMTAF